MATSAEEFGCLPDGRAATLHTLESATLRVRITDYGGRMVSIEAPDRHGRRGHVLLGFGNVAAYHAAGGSFGALLGRSANRIAGGRFTLDGHTYELPRNDGNDTLHGGPAGFGKVFWNVDPQPSSLVLTHVSPDGDQGFPGTLSVRAVYSLAGDTLSLSFEAKTTEPTLVNLSAHPYFNLVGTGDVFGHILRIPADAFLPTDAQQVPTGEIRPVSGTPFDFRDPTEIGKRIWRDDEQLLFGTGYDVCFVLPGGQTDTPRPVAHVLEQTTGRTLELSTTQAGLQLYSGNKLKGAHAGHNGHIYRQSAGFALEAQSFPDAPHHSNFPSTVLRPGETYRETILYRFGTA